MFGFLQTGKDKALSAAVYVWFNNTRKSYGKMTDIHIDSANKSIRVTLELAGEIQPLEIEISPYEILQQDGGTFLRLGGIRTSRAWMNEVIANFLPEEKRTVKIPPAARMML